MVGSNSRKLEINWYRPDCMPLKKKKKKHFYLMGQDLDEWEVGYEVSMIKHEEASGKI